MRIGIDIGGTFTDIVGASSDGRIHVCKVPSTQQNYGDALRGIHRGGANCKREGHREQANRAAGSRSAGARGSKRAHGDGSFWHCSEGVKVGDAHARGVVHEAAQRWTTPFTGSFSRKVEPIPSSLRTSIEPP